MSIPIGQLPDITSAAAASLDLIALDKAREQYRAAFRLHRLEAAVHLENGDRDTARTHLNESHRLYASWNAVLDEVSFRRIRMNVLDAIAKETT